MHRYLRLTDGPTPRENRRRTPIILYRQSVDDREAWANEYRAMNRHFVTTNSRMAVHGGDLVIGRYSVLPFYRELESDLNHEGCNLINSPAQHTYIADLQNWVATLGDMTPTTWDRLEDIPEEGPFVLKGETNSVKNKWNTHMFAQNKKEAIQVYLRLNDDPFISQQRIYIRKFVPMVTLLTSPVNQQPITLEFRFFGLYGKVLSHGFYWSSFVDDLDETPVASPEVIAFAEKVIAILSDHANFMAVDIGVAQNGKPFVVEVNDGQMSGLSENDPNVLYANMKKVVWDDLPGE